MDYSDNGIHILLPEQEALYWGEHCREVRVRLPIIKAMMADCLGVSYCDNDPPAMPLRVKEALGHLQEAEVLFADYFRDYLKIVPSVGRKLFPQLKSGC